MFPDDRKLFRPEALKSPSMTLQNKMAQIHGERSTIQRCTITWVSADEATRQKFESTLETPWSTISETKETIFRSRHFTVQLYAYFEAKDKTTLWTEKSILRRWNGTVKTARKGPDWYLLLRKTKVSVKAQGQPEASRHSNMKWKLNSFGKGVHKAAWNLLKSRKTVQIWSDLENVTKSNCRSNFEWWEQFEDVAMCQQEGSIKKGRWTRINTTMKNSESIMYPLTHLIIIVHATLSTRKMLRQEVPIVYTIKWIWSYNTIKCWNTS